MVPILAQARSLLTRYDVLFCDIWGVVHDGNRAFASACDALTRFRAAGGTVVLVSNAPMPSEHVVPLLDQRGVPRSAWDELLASGDIAIAHVVEQGWRRITAIRYHYDDLLFQRLDAERVGIAEAEAIVCTGLDDDRRETPETHRPLLEAALLRRLPFVCANPDLVVDVGGTLIPCAGSVAQIYEAMGGPVVWTGKPHRPAYAAAEAAAVRLRGRAIEASRILVIGDSVRTDLAGAAGYGVDALFVASGIHRAELMPGGAVDPDALAALLAPPAPTAVAAMPVLAW